MIKNRAIRKAEPDSPAKSVTPTLKEVVNP